MVKGDFRKKLISLMRIAFLSNLRVLYDRISNLSVSITMINEMLQIKIFFNKSTTAGHFFVSLSGKLQKNFSLLYR